MSKTDWKAIIKDEAEIKKLEFEFDQNRKKVSQKVYTSLTEEKLRTNKIIAQEKLNAPIENVFRMVINRACKDLHSSLDYEDLAVNTFYRTSGKTNKLPFKITEFQENKVLTIEYYAKDQQFIKTLRFYPNRKNTKTKIIYTDLTIGLTSILGWLEKHVRGVYIKRQIIAFQVQILNAKLDLDLISDLKINKVQNQINKMLEYSQKAY